MKTAVRFIVSALFLAAAFAGHASAGEKYRIAMLPKFKGENYFDGCYAGAKKAAAELGVTLIYDGPNQSEATNAKQVEILSGFIAANVDAILVSPCDSSGIVPTLRQAMDKGIAVITFDADTATDARLFYVNQATADDIGAGLVEAIVPGLVKNGFGPGKPARLAAISSSGLDSNQNEWLLAVHRYIGANHPWINFAADASGYIGGDIWTPGTDESAAQNASNEALSKSGDAQGGERINAIMGMSSMAAPALGAAYNSMVGRKPKVVLTGIATPLALIDYILDPDNPLDTGVLWDVGALGYLSVEAAKAVLDGKIELGEGTVFHSKLGDKKFVVNPDDGGLELLLGDALIFGVDNVEEFEF